MDQENHHQQVQPLKWAGFFRKRQRFHDRRRCCQQYKLGILVKEAEKYTGQSDINTSSRSSIAREQHITTTSAPTTTIGHHRPRLSCYHNCRAHLRSHRIDLGIKYEVWKTRNERRRQASTSNVLLIGAPTSLASLLMLQQIKILKGRFNDHEDDGQNRDRPAQTQEDRLTYRNEIRRYLLINLQNVATAMRQQIKTIGNNQNHLEEDDTWNENNIRQAQEFATQMDQYQPLLSVNVKDVDETKPVRIPEGIVQAVQSLRPDFLVRYICPSDYTTISIMISLYSRLHLIASESYTPTDADVAYIRATRGRPRCQEATLSVPIRSPLCYLFQTIRVKRLHFWTHVIIPVTCPRGRRLVPAFCSAPYPTARRTFPEHTEISTILDIVDIPEWIALHQQWYDAGEPFETIPLVVEMWLKQKHLRHCKFVLVLTNLSAFPSALSRAADKKALVRLFPGYENLLLPTLDGEEIVCVDSLVQTLVQIFTDLNAKVNTAAAAASDDGGSTHRPLSILTLDDGMDMDEVAVFMSSIACSTAEK